MKLKKVTFSKTKFSIFSFSLIVTLNYCTNDKRAEPEYSSTRSDTFSIQQISDKLALFTNITLSSTDRDDYANMYGSYTSSSTLHRH
jgi:hypothetical protein